MVEGTNTDAPSPALAEAPPQPLRKRLALAGRIGSWLLVAAVTLGPRFLPYQALVVRSGSMAPTIPTGSIVFYRQIAAGDVKVGDVIVFSKPGDPNERVTH